MKAICNAPWKYIYDFKKATDELYNVESDRGELNNLATVASAERGRLREQLFTWVAQSRRYPVKKSRHKIFREEKEKLEALGYIQ